VTKSSVREGKGPSNSVSAARREAFAILLKLQREGSHCDDLLRGPKVSALSAQDRNLCTALVMGTLRWQILLDAEVRPLLNRPNARLDKEILIALRLGAFQLLFMDRIPAHAAIGESVALTRLSGHTFASGMVNAVLRKMAVGAKPDLSAGRAINAVDLAAVTAHPLWMVERWIRNYGLEAARAICLHGQQAPTLTLRVESEAVEAKLVEEGIQLEGGSILAAARRVVSGDIVASNAFRSGQVRIQDEGSQLIAELAGHGSDILDCCAAPGGKTLILAERNPRAAITAAEFSVARLEGLRLRLAEITAHQPELTGRIRLVQSDAAKPVHTAEFDLVLADVPCSGTGTLGRNPEIRHRLEVVELARYHERQCEILRGALSACKPVTPAGASRSRVFYSTCSLEPEENGAVVAEVLADAPDWQQVSLAGRIQELLIQGRITHSGADFLMNSLNEDGSLSLLPGNVFDTDGFFVAALERKY
jgi:16S rRNA (cytosine967-C5)-methyltransferase